MTLLTQEDILLVHDKVIAATGGLPGLRDSGLLESAVLSVDASFGEVERYPAVEEKAARLAFALIGNHPFLDGNKRVGVLAMLMTLSLNGITLRYTQPDLVRLGLSAAQGTADYQDILEWILAHK